ncbi:MAG: two-component regulator propeller domain-containing protein [Rhodothermales bacterium]
MRMNARRYIACLGLLVVLSVPSTSRAQIGEWEAHTSFRQVVDLSASNNAIWVATSGGVFSYAPASQELRRFTPAEGLHSVLTRAILYSEGCACVWIGYQDGVLDRLDVETGVVRSFRDIERAGQFASRTIRRLHEQGDSLLVATDFGLVVFDPLKGEVRDTYNQLGSFTPGVPVYDVAVGALEGQAPAFWLATREGVASTPLSTPNPKDPGSWSVETISGSGELTAVALFEGALYAGGEDALYRRDGAGVYSAIASTSAPIRRLRQVQDRLVGVSLFSLIAVDAGGAPQSGFDLELQAMNAVIEGPQGLMWVGDDAAGLAAVEPIATGVSDLSVLGIDIYPEGPYDGQFSDLTFAADGTLWLGGVRGTNVGFYKLGPDGAWTSYTSRFYDELVGRRTEFRAIDVDSRGHTWVGSFGGALLEVTPDDEIIVHDQSNSSLRRSESVSDETFIIIGGIDSQADGTVWVTNVDAARPISVWQPGAGWTSLPSPIGSGQTLGRLFIDSYGQKWIVAIDRRNLRVSVGLVVVETGSTPADPTDDAFIFISEEGGSGQGLPSIGVNAIVEDRDGLVWIGTDEGLAYVVNTGIVARDPNTTPIWPIRADRKEGESQFLLFGLKVNDLAVDPANRLWVATDEGVWLIEEAGLGFQELAHYTTENSPLFSDVIVSVAVDERTGDVYIGTDAGLLSFRSDAIAPAEQSQDLVVYPNPARFSEASSPTIFMEGLVEETDIRILTVDGQLIQEIEARGGRAQWDGRDRAGRDVPSGMYLIIAVGTNGEKAAVGKVAIIR